MPTRLRRLVVLATSLCVVLVCAAPAAAQPTYVSLTFDDGSASQYKAKAMFASHGMSGTFYINSGRVGLDHHHMTWSNVRALAAAGHEIGGHTVNHLDLTKLAPARQRAEICKDRQNLIRQGFDPTSFAFPYAAWDSTSRAATQACGYASARAAGNAGCLPGCPAAESIPPVDPYVLRTLAGVTRSTSLSTIEGWVTNAVQNGGGWVIIVLHDICNGCSINAISPQDMSSLLEWLQGQASNGVSVKTVAEVTRCPSAALSTTRDATPPQLRLIAPRSVKRRSLIRGLTVAVGVSEACSLKLELLGRSRSSRRARKFSFPLGSKSFATSGAGMRTLRLRPWGIRSRRAVKSPVEVRVTVFDGAENRTLETRRIRVR